MNFSPDHFNLLGWLLQPLRSRLSNVLQGLLLGAGLVLVAACPGPIWAQDFSAADQGKPSQVSDEALKMLSQTTIPDAEATNIPSMAGNTASMATNITIAPIASMDALDDLYKLKIGDSIDYQVIEDEDDPKPLVVTDSGDLEVPYLGRYPAEGKTCKQLAEELKIALEKKYYYQATVIISVNSRLTQGVIYLVGGVKAPGPLEIPRDDVLTVSKAILRAGGFDDFADEKHVRVTRKSESGTNEVLTVNVSAVLDKGQTAKDVQAEPGDLIYVPEKSVRF
jgi:polysaccharide biosynthesis/export protein